VDEKRIFIGEEFAEGANGRWREVLNPATGEVIAEVPECSEGHVDRAVTAAQRAFESGSIPRRPNGPGCCAGSPTPWKGTGRSLQR
jgi:acyl-CoA reductase-like NAD-dependent aldehyde dehydrogenase